MTDERVPRDVRLREELAAGLIDLWVGLCDDPDDAEFVRSAPETVQEASEYADLYAPLVERIVAARVGEVVERVEAVAAIPEQCHCGLPQVETGRAIRRALAPYHHPLTSP